MKHTNLRLSVKIIITFVLLFSFQSEVTAQEKNFKENQRVIEVLESHWRKANRFNRELDSHSTMLSDAPENVNQVSHETSPVLVVGKGYQYTIKIKNNAAKKIKLIKWSFDFIDPVTLEKIDSHQFTSEKRISAGKSKKLIGFSISPPTKIIDALLAEKAGEDPYKRVIVINRIEYADGTVWTQK